MKSLAAAVLSKYCVKRQQSLTAYMGRLLQRGPRSCKLQRKDELPLQHRVKKGFQHSKYCSTNCFSFKYTGFLKFGVDEATLDPEVSQRRFQDEQETGSNDKDKDGEVEVGVEMYLLRGHKTLVLQFDGSRWGDSNPDLVVVVTAKTAFDYKLAPWLGISIKCSMWGGDACPRVGLSSVELFLPKSLIRLHLSNGICFWEELFHYPVVDGSTLPSTFRSWPVRNPAFLDHDPQPKGLMPAGSTDQHHTDPELLPIRVIDIEATLASHGGICFYKPTDWSFHTVSHTWSLYVRAFSVAVGKLVSNSHELYDRAFEDVDFTTDNPLLFQDPQIREEAPKCYRQLIEFFRLLQGEGVKAVWFDALCINQLKEDEKTREIAQMGIYYASNRGCYVLSHGVGMGFSLWSLEGDKVKLPPPAGPCSRFDHHCSFEEFRPALPRWFHRVWTLQEFILPRKLTFIVSELAKVTIGRVNNFILKGSGSRGLCMCALPARDAQFRYWDRGGNLRNAGEEENILGSERGVVCLECGHAPFIRESNEKGVYFVDREAYCFLCQVDLGPTRHWVQHSMQWHPEFVLWNLTAVAFSRHAQGFLTQATSMSMLRNRQCSNEEDRVLGVLGLLRDAKQGKFQLRSGQSLRAQLWKLPRAMGPSVFLKLCMINEAGSSEVGMSWAPTCLISDEQLPGVSPFNFSLKGDLNVPIRQCAMVLQAYEEGPLQGILLVASILRGEFIPGGHVMPCRRVNPNCLRMRRRIDMERQKVESLLVEADQLNGVPLNEFEIYCLDCLYHSRSCEHLIRHCKLVLQTSEDRTLTFSLAAHEGGCDYRSMVRISSLSSGADFRMILAGVSSVSALKRFPVRLVLLLTTSENVFGFVCIVRLVENREVLHKIGTFSCPVELNPFPWGNRDCLIGGFGSDISKDLCA